MEFPAKATARLRSGETKEMRDLQLGDLVLDASGAFSPVIVFGHADAATSAEFVRLELEASGDVLELSPRHFIPVWGIQTFAKDVRVGDALARWTGTGFETDVVAKKTSVVADGIYNPYTVSGSIVVDGVLASCHSEWFLDDATPEGYSKYLPAVYQRVLVVVRGAYAVLGPRGMDAVFGVGNTGKTASYEAQTAMFFSVVAILALGVFGGVSVAAALRA